MSVPAGLRREVTSRAANRCEYCQLAQARQEAAFHVDHVYPVAEGGRTVLENLALACVSCSLRKGARRVVRDPLSGKEVPVFHPRLQVWTDHFIWQGTRVQGLTATGRATISLLKMNRALAVAIRTEERRYRRQAGAE